MRQALVSCFHLKPILFVLPAMAAALPGLSLAGNPAEYTVYNFSALSGATNKDGAGPIGAIVVGPDGSYYGTTWEGGASGMGTVFKIAPDGSFTNLHSFAGTDGSYPVSLMMASDGNLYGTTLGGAVVNDYGNIFKVTRTGLFTVLHKFVIADGQNAFGAMVQGSDGNLYGTAEFGGASGYGTVFRVSTTGSFSVLHDFNPAVEGAMPFQGLTIGVDGNFYGTTSSTAFKITPAGALTTLHNFAVNDGSAHSGLVRGLDDNFYGVTNVMPQGGSASGIFFRLTPDGTYTALSALDAPTYAVCSGWVGCWVGPNVDGLDIHSSLTRGPDGNFYGAASSGGATRSGTVFRVAPDGSFTNLHSFNTKPDSTGKQHAGNLQGPVSFDRSGNMIGAGMRGGANGTGAVYKVVMASALTSGLTIAPDVAAAGAPATFSWTSTGATSCSFIGKVIKSGSLPPSGSVTHAGPAPGKKMVTAIQCKDAAGGLSNSTASLTAN